jgi:hypothetical protein
LGDPRALGPEESKKKAGEVVDLRPRAGPEVKKPQRM